MGGFIYAIMKIVKVKKVKNWLLDFLNMACINNLRGTLVRLRLTNLPTAFKEWAEENGFNACSSSTHQFAYGKSAFSRFF